MNRIALIFKKHAALAPYVIILTGLCMSAGIFYLKDAAAAVTVTATVAGICGDDIADSGEQCDGVDLAGATCRSLGYDTGTLTCHTDCTAYIVSSCTGTAPVVPPPSSGGGGGGGGGGGSPSGSSGVVLSGRAYPGTKVTLLRDTTVVASVVAGPDAVFEISLSNITKGIYNFNLLTEDIYGIKSEPFAFPVTLTNGVTAKVSGVFLAPTIIADKIEVKKGDVIKLFGQSVPQKEVTITVNSETPHFFKTMTDASGIYLQNVDSSILEFGDHEAVARAALEGEISGDSTTYEFKVGAKNVMSEIKAVFQVFSLQLLLLFLPLLTRPSFALMFQGKKFPSSRNSR